MESFGYPGYLSATDVSEELADAYEKAITKHPRLDWLGAPRLR